MPSRGLRGDLGEELFRLDDFQDSQASGSRQGAAAEGRPVRARLEKRIMRRSHPDSADGETAAESLGHGDGIGLHASAFKGKEITGPADAALNFVNQQQNVPFRSKFTQTLQELGRRLENTALPLNGFDQHRRGGLGVDGLVPRG